MANEPGIYYMNSRRSGSNGSRDTSEELPRIYLLIDEAYNGVVNSDAYSQARFLLTEELRKRRFPLEVCEDKDTLEMVHERFLSPDMERMTETCREKLATESRADVFVYVRFNSDETNTALEKYGARKMKMVAVRVTLLAMDLYTGNRLVTVEDRATGLHLSLGSAYERAVRNAVLNLFSRIDEDETMHDSLVISRLMNHFKKNRNIG